MILPEASAKCHGQRVDEFRDLDLDRPSDTIHFSRVMPVRVTFDCRMELIEEFLRDQSYAAQGPSPAPALASNDAGVEQVKLLDWLDEDREVEPIREFPVVREVVEGNFRATEFSLPLVDELEQRGVIFIGDHGRPFEDELAPVGCLTHGYSLIRGSGFPVAV